MASLSDYGMTSTQFLRGAGGGPGRGSGGGFGGGSGACARVGPSCQRSEPVKP